MKKTHFLVPVLMMIMTGCTLNVTMVHTEGLADNVVDQTDSTEADISPNLSIPAKL